MKKYLIIFLAIVTLILAIFLLFKLNDKGGIVKKSESLCYYYSNKSARGFYDKFWLTLNIVDQKVNGEFYSSPAEKDLKSGTFDGTVGSVDEKTMSQTADLFWDSLAEGMQVKEELIFKFGDKSANIGAGEMIDRGDGVYVYKDKTQLFYTEPTMNKISCDTLNEINFVEKYVKDNIKTIATNKPVLGGSWYAIAVHADPIQHSGNVVYEDGHIQSIATFEYEYDNNTKNVVIKNFKVE